mmetsp:Transcript_66101/g.158123  ORF Transcript_66101/g.158123 Transcript_66101/m.158123 type:complete len:1159 (+) Transcript_66101:123-3599(+)
MSALIAVCQTSCEDVSLEFVEVQLVVAFIPWFCMTVGGLIAACVLERVPNKSLSQRLLIFENGVCSTGIGASILLLIAHMLQALFFAMRSTTRRVNAGYHSVEIVLTILCLADLVFKWIYSTFRGVRVLLAYAFGDLVLDCIVMTPAIAVTVPVNGQHTWFSFAYLASYRLYRLLRNGMLVDEVTCTWHFRMAYHILTFFLLVFTASATVMLCEHLGDEDVTSKSTEWRPLESFLFIAFTMGTIGGGELTPRTTMGRALAVVIICWAFIAVYKPLVSLSFRWLVETSMHRSRLPFVTSKWGHAVICGTARPFMIMDFLHEIYHFDNYSDTAAFVEEAPNIVIMVPSGETLQALRQLLRRRDCLDFRARVHLLRGDPVDASGSEHRELLRTSQVSFVLPDLHAKDVRLDDAGNLLRAYALNNHSQTTICMLHCASTYPQQSQAMDRRDLRFVSIDAFKMSLMAKACISRGVASCLCNLWRTVGVAAAVSSAEPWQKQYLEGLCHEIYEVELSTCYDGETFGAIALDVLCRAQNADVYFIGIVNLKWDMYGNANRIYRIHPGADFEVAVSPKACYGIFLAQDVSSIKQAKPGDDLFNDRDIRRPRTTLRANASNGDLDSLLGSMGGRTSVDQSSAGDFSPSPSLSTFSPASSTHELRRDPTKRRNEWTNRVVVPSVAGAVEDEKKEAEKEKAPSSKITLQAVKSALPKQYYNTAMRDLQRSMLVYGVDLGSVTDICRAVEFKEIENDLAPGMLRNGDAAQQGDAEHASHLHGRFGPPGREHDWSTEEGRHTALEYFHSMQHRVVHDMVASRPHPPPPGVLEAGGHIVICIAMGRPAHKRAAIGELGPDICLLHFLQPLRDIGLDGSPQPSIVILSDVLPKDWHIALEAGNVYFVQGSPLQPADLEAVRIQKARAVAIIRGGSNENDRNGGTDAHVILATMLIEQNLPAHSKIPVVTQLVYDSSISFLPVWGRGCATDSTGRLAPKVRPPRQVEAPMLDLQLLVSALRKTGLYVGGVAEVAQEQSDVASEDYSELWAAQPLEHPRFMQGQIVFSSLLMQLAGKSLHNTNHIRIVQALIDTSMIVVPVPEAFVRRSIMDLYVWLLREKNLLCIAIYRHSHADPYWKKNDELIEYIFTGPKTCDELAFKSDKVICLVPSVLSH